MGVATARPGGAGHPHFVVPRFDEKGSFGIRHYAGEGPSVTASAWPRAKWRSPLEGKGV